MYPHQIPVPIDSVNVSGPHFEWPGILLTHTVNRVHWIRARAQNNRWKEEYTLVRYEMQWTVRYYLNHARMWKDRAQSAQGVGDAGATAYAMRKAATWTEFAASAEDQFIVVNSSYKHLQSLYQRLAEV
jgi:hypothetical protein